MTTIINQAGLQVTATPNTVAELTPVNTLTNPGPQGLNDNRLLCSARAVNLNGLGDTLMPIINAGTYSVANIIVTNASISLTTASFSIYTAPNGASGSGTAIRAVGTSTGNTGPTVVTQATVATTATQTVQGLYFNVGIVQGAAATADIFVYGYDLT
jgi:hypothetical protein